MTNMKEHFSDGKCQKEEIVVGVPLIQEGNVVLPMILIPCIEWDAA